MLHDQPGRERHIAPEPLAALSGLMLALSYPPFDLFFLAWGAWIPLWVALEYAGWRHGFRLGYLTGLVFTLLTFNWIANNSGTNLLVATSSMLGSVFYLSLFFGLFGFLLASVGRRLGTDGFWLAPVLWVSLEYLYSFPSYDLAFPWMSLAMTQNFMVPILQLAEYGGIYLVSLWVMSINLLLFQLEFGRLSVRTQQLLWGILGFGIVGTIIFGGVRISVVKEAYDQRIRVAALQTNLDPHDKWIRSKKMEHINDLVSMSTQAADSGASIIVWPESAVPAPLAYYPQIDRRIKRFTQEYNVSVLTGALHHEREGDSYKFFNSAFFYAPGMAVPIYSKQRLVPFAERIPLSDRYPSLKQLNFGQANFEPGQEALVYPMGNDSLFVPMGTLICYESADPSIFKRFMENGAELMSIITNDAWLGHSLGPAQHLAAGRLRAIEHRVSVVRSAQTGISALIMPSGLIPKKLDLGRRGILVGDMPVGLERPFYSRRGEIVGLGTMLIAGLGLLAISFVRRKPLP